MKNTHTAKADFVHTVAKSLVVDHAHTWPSALQIAKSCWAKLDPKYHIYIDGSRRPPASVPEAVKVAEVADEGDVALQHVLDVPAR